MPNSEIEAITVHLQGLNKEAADHGVGLGSSILQAHEIGGGGGVVLLFPLNKSKIPFLFWWNNCISNAKPERGRVGVATVTHPVRPVITAACHRLYHHVSYKP